MVLDAVDVAVLDPLAQLVVALRQLGKVLAPEARDVALERAGVRLAAGTERTVAGEAVELEGEVGALRGQRLVRDELAGRGAQVGDQVFQLRVAQEATVGGHAQSCLLHLGDVMRIVAPPLRRTLDRKSTRLNS